MAKSYRVALLLWATLGLLGGHHFYLRRDRHGVVHLLTLGGFFIGWLWDLPKLAGYVRWANVGNDEHADDDDDDDDDDSESKDNSDDSKDKDNNDTNPILDSAPACSGNGVGGGDADADADNNNCVKQTQHAKGSHEVKKKPGHRKKKNKKPSDSLWSGVAETAVCHWMVDLVRAAVPSSITAAIDAELPYAMVVVNSLVIAAVVHYTGNIGRTRGSFQNALKGALFTLPYYLYSPSTSVIWCVLVSRHTLDKSYRRKPERVGSVRQRTVRNLIIVLAVTSLYVSYLRYNCETETESGESVTCLEMMSWTNLKSIVHSIYTEVKARGLQSIWTEIMNAFDTTDEDNAMSLLDVTSSASEAELRNAYKRLARQHHPDRFRDPGERAAAQEKFMQIQKAYELLSVTKSKRQKSNRKSRDTSHDEL